MKNKALIITTILFFLIVNTGYYWEEKIDTLVIPVFMFLVGVFFVLLILLLRQIILAIEEKFKSKQRILVILLVSVVLVLTYLRPAGLIDFENLEGNDILVAEREGTNCGTTFKLKQNNKFTNRNICFGIKETKGNYVLKNDTIFFENVQFARGEKEFYKFAIIKPHEFNNSKITSDLVLYNNFTDTTGTRLWVIKK